MISNKLHLYHQLYDFYHIKVNPDHISSTKVLVTLYHTIKEKETTMKIKFKLMDILERK